MKPYSKKYLTLALAGVLAASMPVSAFATGNEKPTSEPTKKEQPADSTNKPGTPDPAKPKTEEEKAKEAEEKAKEAEEKAKEEINAKAEEAKTNEAATNEAATEEQAK